MSCRRYSQPAPKNKQVAAQAATRKREVLVIGHLGDMVGVNFLENARAFRQMEFRILRLDANKKTVRRRVSKPGHVENRMMRLGQFVQPEHAENRGEPGAQNRQLKSDGNEGPPAIERAAADVHGIGGWRHPRRGGKTAKTTRPTTHKAKG